MDKSTTGANSREKDTFKNTPHVSERNTSSATEASDADLGTGMSARMGSSIGDAKNAIMEQARPAVDYVRNNLRPVMDNSQQYLTDARGVVTRYPFYAIAGAAAIGVVVGMMFTRSSRSI